MLYVLCLNASLIDFVSSLLSWNWCWFSWGSSILLATVESEHEDDDDADTDEHCDTEEWSEEDPSDSQGDHEDDRAKEESPDGNGNLDDSSEKPTDEWDPFEGSNEWNEKEVVADDEEKPSDASEEFGCGSVRCMQVGNDIVNAMFTFLNLMDNFLERSFEEH